ncbi:YjgN family protein [Neisseria animalis]|uniref:DUF898 domain-containing protein n=1 Tax=Neisseria animalis TaxID=492 RepID=A0A5P3MNT0_NEIAN|nr:YjgN family protein [Neisseria animalis]QEY23138.1 DUF898 domain-containing protein [Neisseria animalis]ROW32469.1 DUF898 domain-containing protein [Neisseria animalis]VEE08221.1 Inner membrane protein yjgN [Neisseria animalis]
MQDLRLQTETVPQQGVPDSEINGIRMLRFSFYGNSTEYFKIWIVNLFLSIITLSFYSPWAKVRNLRYFYGNTELAGERFDFTALPSRILIGRIIAVLLFVAVSVLSQLDPVYSLAAWAVFFLIMPWLVRSTMRFRARNSKYGNSRFYFSAGVGGTYWLFIKCLLVTVFSFGLLYPLALYWFKSYQINHLRLGNLPLHLRSGVGSFYKAVILPYLVMMVVVLLIGMLGVFVGGVERFADGEAGNTLYAAFGLMMTLVYVVMLGLFVPLTQGYLFQATWQNVTLGNNLISTDLNPFTYAWIKFSNYIVTVLSLGLLRPWALVRLYRYQSASMMVGLYDSPQDLLSLAQDNPHSIGEEISDVFDIDISL